MNATGTMVRRLFLVIVVVVGSVPEAHAQRLGRLFTSADERASLDEIRRQAGIPKPPPLPVPEPEPVARAPVQVVTPTGPSISRLVINGVVRSSRGPGTVWVNGDLVDRGGISREGVAVESTRGSAGNVRLRLPSGAGTVALRPGQQIDIDSGVLLEAYEERASEARTSAFSPPADTRHSPTQMDRATKEQSKPSSALPESPAGAPGSSDPPPGAVQSALGSLADPGSARSSYEKAGIERMRERVEESLRGSSPAKKP